MKKIGEKIKGLGEIIAIMWIGERYYALKDKSGAISLMPASVIETNHET